MKTIPVKARIKKDGTLSLNLKTGLPASDVDVVVVVQPVDPPKKWPKGFIKRTYGCLKDTPLERPPQGVFETREQFE